MPALELGAFDVVIVGAGAAGAWAAQSLTARGLCVLVLEAGRLNGEPPAEAPPDGAYRIQSNCVTFSPGTRHFFARDDQNPYTTPADAPFEWIRGRHEGGRTNIWLNVSVRLSDLDLRPVDDGPHWPISYADLEPFYGPVERAWGVRGNSDGIAVLPDGAYLPPRGLNAAEANLKAGIEARWPDRHVIEARVAMRPPVRVLEEARATGNLTIRGSAVVRRVVTGPASDRAEGVLFLDQLTGEEWLARATVVMLCASTLESTRILLNSATPAHPRGLGNSSGTLGHYLMDHVTTWRFQGLAPAVPPEKHSDGIGVIIPRFRNTPDQPQPFVGGYHVQGLVFKEPPPAPRWAEMAAAARRESCSVFSLVGFGEVVPRFENRLTMMSETDAWGVPVPHIHLQYGESERLLVADHRESMREMLHATNFRVMAEVPPGAPGSSVHEVGGARMGSEPSTSVLDPHNRLWDVPNVFVTDGAAFPRSPCQNPTLTIAALTGRACDYIARQLGRTTATRG